MQWLPVLIALLLLLLPVLKARRAAADAMFQPCEPFEDLLDKAAALHGVHALRPFKAPVLLRFRLRRALRSLHALPADHQTDASCMLCGNSGFLLHQTLHSTKGIPPLPSIDGLQPRVCLFARALVETARCVLSSAELTQALMLWQQKLPLGYYEWLVLPEALRFALVERVCLLCVQWAKGDVAAESQAIAALRSLHMLETVPWNEWQEHVCPIHIKLQTDPVYRAMALESRIAYRRKIADIARATHRSETEVADAVMTLCTEAASKTLESHTGYYLLDKGYPSLLHRLHSAPLQNRIRCFLLQHACAFRRLGRLSCFLLLLFLFGKAGFPPLMWFPAALVFLRPFLRSRSSVPLPRIRLDHLSSENATLVVLPAQLSSISDAFAAVRQLYIMHLANPDPHLHFLLLGEYPPTLSPMKNTDAEVLTAASQAIDTLSESSDHSFFYLHLERGLPGDDLLHTILSLTTSVPAGRQAAYASINPAELSGRYRYVILTKPGMLLPPGSALKMIGAMLHPLQQRRQHNHRMRGAAVLQPRTAAAPHAKSNAFSSMQRCEWPLSQGNCSLFDGTGIIDPCALQADACPIAPEGCMPLQDVTIFTQPKHTLHEVLRSRQQHLQNLLHALLQAFRSRRLTLERRSLLWRSLLEALCAPAQLIILLYAAFSGRGWLWALTLLFASSGSITAAILHIATLPCSAFTAVAVFVRTLFQQLTGRDLPILRGSPAAPSVPQAPFLFAINMSCAAAFAFLSLLPHAAVPACWLTAGAWALSAFVMPVLEEPYRQAKPPTAYMREVLMRIARRTFTFFETAITDADHALPPQSIQLEPNTGIEHSTSPDVIGLYLCSLLCAQKLGLLETAEAVRRIQSCADSLAQLPKWNGLPYDRYDTHTLQPAQDARISAEQCGILAVSLLTCAQGIRILLPQLNGSHAPLAAQLDELAEGMQLNQLYDPGVRLFFSFVQPGPTLRTSGFERLLASPSQLVSFAAIMLGKVPGEHWYSLSRQSRADRVLLTPCGGMSDDLLATLFEPMVRNTLLSHSRLKTIRMQRRKRLAGVYGMSRSACRAFQPDLRFRVQPFGLPALTQNAGVQSDVISPYAGLLALPFEPKNAFLNLQRLSVYGMDGPLGLFDALDFSPERTQGHVPEVVRCHLAKHQAIVLCAICNTLSDSYLVRLFSALPRFQACRLLLEEPLSAAQKQLLHRSPIWPPAPLCPSDALKRTAQPLCFPVDAHLLHSGTTTWLIDAQGGGCLLKNGRPATSFSENCAIPSGPRLYLRDSESGVFWMPADPTMTREVRFESAQAVFVQELPGLSCTLSMWISPLDGSALQSLTLENTGSSNRMLEACSFWEINGPFRSARRLCRNGIQVVSGSRIWHHLLTADEALAITRIQCDRTSLIGRGRNVLYPRALETPISAAADQLCPTGLPCLSLRGQFLLPAGRCVHLSFVTRVDLSEQNSSEFCTHYADTASIERLRTAAQAAGAACAQFWDQQQESWHLCSRLTGALAYTDQPVQHSTAVHSFDALKQYELDPSSRILLAECSADTQRKNVSFLLKAHAFFQAIGFPFALVFALRVRTRASSVRELLEEEISRSFSHCSNSPEGIVVIERAEKEELEVLRASARLNLQADQAFLPQLEAFCQFANEKTRFFYRSSTRPQHDLPPSEDPVYFNGFGGFVPNGYQITLSPGTHTPSPWRNPIGTVMADENGLASGKEAFFLRDEEEKLLWSPTREPLGFPYPVRTTHAPGESTFECCAHGISTRIICFSCEGASADVRFIHIRNEDEAPRTLRLFHQRSVGPAHLQSQELCITGCDPVSGKHFCMFSAEAETCEHAAMSAGLFHGLWGVEPYVLSTQDALPDPGGGTAVLCHPLRLAAHSQITVADFWAEADTAAELIQLMDKLRNQSAGELLRLSRQRAEERLSLLQAELPDPAASLLFSRWIPLQFQYTWTQAPLPDLSELFPMVYFDPQRLQNVLSECIRRRDHGGLFEQTLLPLLCSRCAAISGDHHFLKGDLRARCVRMLLKIPLGEHGLPAENGERVWLGMLLCEACRMLMPFCAEKEHDALANRRSALLKCIDQHAWDGGWYLSGWTPEGERIGSGASPLRCPDIAAQSWAVMCGASRERCEIAMENIWRFFSSQKTSAAFGNTLHVFWAACAFHQLGQNERAWKLLLARLPVPLSATKRSAIRYQREPYALAMEIAPSGQGQRVLASGGAGWCWCILLEDLLGFKLRGSTLRFTPVVPPQWHKLHLTFRCGSAVYRLHADSRQRTATADGEPLTNGSLCLCADGRTHEAFYPLRS